MIASFQRLLEHHAKIGNMVTHHLYEGLVLCRQWVGLPIPPEDHCWQLSKPCRNRTRMIRRDPRIFSPGNIA